MANIDYVRIIEEYNTDAFNDCVRQLYPILGFRYIKREEVRKIDLIEKCLELEVYERCFLSNKKLEPLENYVNQVRVFADNNINPGESVKAYYDKAKRVTEEILSGNDNIEKVEDLVKIFISFSRSEYPHWEDSKKKYDPFFFDIRDDDWKVLKSLIHHDFKSSLVTKMPEKAMYNIYYVTVLIYCRIMQYEGVYEKDGGDNA